MMGRSPRSAGGRRSASFRIHRAGTPAAAAFEKRILERRSEISDADELASEVRLVISRVRRGGRAALARLVCELDQVPLGPEQLVLPAAANAPSAKEVPEKFRRALDLAIARVAAFARAQLPKGFVLRDRSGTYEELVAPIDAVGCYVPGGRAAYPSTAVMTVVPAKVAGVPRVVVATPPKAYFDRPELRWAIAEAGADEVLLAGGAHSLAALAWGLEGFLPVAKIVGPGSKWVNAAKRQLFGQVGIDTLAGPTEIVILADGSADPELVAADLLAQAEHDPQAAAILVTSDEELLRPVASAIEERLAALPERSPARESLPAFGGALVVSGLDEGVAWIERFAPEHLQVVTLDAARRARTIRSCGAIFVGQASGEVFGDYVAGPNHVLPTGGGARVFSPLSSADFVRRTNVLHLTPDGAASLAADAAVFGDVEGFPAHAASARLRGGGGER
jgi:histidinol dehydrogenase